MRWLTHWNVACFGASGNLVHEVRSVAKYIHEVDAVAPNDHSKIIEPEPVHGEKKGNGTDE